MYFADNGCMADKALEKDIVIQEWLFVQSCMTMSSVPTYLHVQSLGIRLQLALKQ